MGGGNTQKQTRANFHLEQQPDGTIVTVLDTPVEIRLPPGRLDQINREMGYQKVDVTLRLKDSDGEVLGDRYPYICYVAFLDNHGAMRSYEKARFITSLF